MGKTKKTEEVLKPSKYQEDILEFIQHDVGNLVVEASAGCGKTSTLIMAIKAIDPSKSILFCAFNKDIVKEIKKKTKEFDNVDVTTVHGLGLRILKANMHNEKLIPNDNKYRVKFINNTKLFTHTNTYGLGAKNYSKYLKNVFALLNLVRLNLYQTIEEAKQLALLHGLNLVADEAKVVFKLMEWGKKNLNEVDYTDMIWLPNELSLQPYGVRFDYVFGDEAQDFSTAQRELLLRCRKINTRFIFVGDENQAIYAFASADKDSFEKLKKIPNTKTLPLPISYRCAKNIVKFAQNYVKAIESNDADERMGEVKYNASLEEISDGDMVLCRNNAPLMQLYNYLISKEKKCYIKGKDVGKNLKTLINDTKAIYLHTDLKHDGLFVQLYDGLFSLRDYLMTRQNLDKEGAMNSLIFTNLLDKIQALEALAFGLTTCDELITKIDTIFSDKDLEGISLSTIHKAKGLEAERVFIACPSLMPHKLATQPWEMVQEKNLMYVAYTRAKNLLGFLEENTLLNNAYTNVENLKAIEKQVNTVLNKVALGIERKASDPIEVLTDKPHSIIIPRKGASKVLDNTNAPTKIENNLNNVIKKKITKKIKVLN